VADSCINVDLVDPKLYQQQLWWQFKVRLNARQQIQDPDGNVALLMLRLT
jgi:hypothetical protein